jgi:hypothetical protein
MPWHLECQTSDEPVFDAILSYMYCRGCMARLLGEAAFHHLNPGPDASAGDRDVNARVVTRNITMVLSMGRVNLRGLKSPNKPALLQRYDDEDPNELEIEVNKSMRDIMMLECKKDGTLVWCMTAHIRERNGWDTIGRESGTTCTRYLL